MHRDYIPDNVFRHEFPTDLGKIETPLRVLNLSPQRDVVVNAIWDTGSTYSSVSHRVARLLELSTGGKSVSIGIGGAVSGSTSLCFAFPGNQRYAAMVDASLLQDVEGVPDFIIGLDIILMGELTLRSRGEMAELQFKFDTSKFIDFEGDDSMTMVRKTSAFYEQMRRNWTKFNK